MGNNGLFWLLCGVTAWVFVGSGLFFLHVAGMWTPSRVMFTLFSGELALYWYSFFIVCAVLLGAAVVVQLAKEAGDEAQIVWRGLTWLLIFGFVGARLFYVTFPPPSDALLGIESGVDYWRNLSLLVSVRLGGLRLFGALFGGGLGWLLYSYRFGLPIWVWLDRLALGMAAGLAVGYWGHFFNQGLYGRPTTLFWGWPIAESYRLPEFANAGYFQPIFLFGSLWMLCVVWGLFLFSRFSNDPLRPGRLWTLFLLALSMMQLSLSPMLINESLWQSGPLTGWSVHNVVSIGLLFLIVIGQGFTFIRREY